MTFRHKFLAAVMVTLVAAGSATASSITYSLIPGDGGPGTFKLTAQTSAGDNFGLSYYAVALTGVSTISHDNVTPRLTDFETGKTYGFSFARSQDTNISTISAAQDSTGGGLPVYGLGQVAGNLKALTPAGNPTGSARPDALGTFGVPLVLATGTYAQSAPPVIGNTAGFVFTSQGTGSAFGAFAAPDNFIVNQFPSVVIPEPATIALSGLAIVGLLGMRRRTA